MPIGIYQEEPRIEESRIQDADTWMGPASELTPGLSGTARVVLLPDQLVPDEKAGDPKDSDGYVPPRIPIPGDRLRTS
ncbi:hypothetical protein ACFV0T_20345 [Streptomyces sp. NPDC059582]|uniref:hypothetical protein n=1 Tax=Streptomyces sp. NPDC059582 TaxID=3346875 RepID=UPI0036BD6EC5